MNFAEFAAQPEYIAVNKSLVRRLCERLPNAFVHVDVATGTGMVPKLIIEQCRRLGITGRIIGIDPNPVSLAIARETTPAEPCDVTYLEGFGQDTASLVCDIVPRSGVDSVSIHDALHEIASDEDKQTTIDSMARTLRPGGLFTFNSAFTTAGMGSSAMDWGRWKAVAMQILGQRRNKDAEAMRMHTPDEYRQMLVSAGLTIVYEATDRVVELSRSALDAICRYPAFVDGVFKDMFAEERFSMEEKSRALIGALDRMNVSSIRRVWVEMLAEKRVAPA